MPSTEQVKSAAPCGQRYRRIRGAQQVNFPSRAWKVDAIAPPRGQALVSARGLSAPGGIGTPAIVTMISTGSSTFVSSGKRVLTDFKTPNR